VCCKANSMPTKSHGPAGQSDYSLDHGEISPDRVTAVMVTYGDRRPFVEHSVAAALREGVGRLVLVSNAARWDVVAWACETARDKLDVVQLPENRGSAGGYVAGLRRALDLGAELIWMLDDDNMPEQGCLRKLLTAWAELIQHVDKTRFALVAYRPACLADLGSGVPINRISTRTSSFWGFHILDVPYKIWRRTSWGKPKPPCELPPLVELDEGPWGGMLLHRALLEAIGMPREGMVLYADDTEFTRRLRLRKGLLYCVTSATVVDLGPKWADKSTFSTSFEAWLLGGNDARVYYGARNHSYVDAHYVRKSQFVFWLNRIVYLAVLYALAVLHRRLPRFTLLKRAIRHGLCGQMGRVLTLDEATLQNNSADKSVL
jgi:GT2 family glycosyltransferase